MLVPAKNSHPKVYIQHNYDASFGILSLQIKFSPEPEKFILDDGYQPPATLTSPSREILGATFYKYVLKNIGMYTTEIDLGSKHQI